MNKLLVWCRWGRFGLVLTCKECLTDFTRYDGPSFDHPKRSFFGKKIDCLNAGKEVRVQMEVIEII